MTLLALVLDQDFVGPWDTGTVRAPVIFSLCWIKILSVTGIQLLRGLQLYFHSPIPRLG